MADLQCEKCKQWKGIRDFNWRQPDGTGARELSGTCLKCSDPLDFDVYYMDPSELIDTIKNLRAGIRAHRDATGHNLCWWSTELWDLLPEKIDPTPEVPPTEEFLAACRLYRRSLDK